MREVPLKADPRVDPEVRRGLAESQSLLGSSNRRTVQAVRAFRERRDALLMAAPADLSANPTVAVEERIVPGATDAPGIRVKIHRPAQQADLLPGFYHIHGGGMITGSIDGEESRMAAFVEQVGCVVVSVDYRLAPEHPYPAPVEDCYAGLRWMAEHAAELRIDPERIAVGGESAGGGLSAATVMLARDRHGPRVAFLYLVSPMLDDRNDTPSSHEFCGEWPGWPRELNLLGWRALLGDAVGGPDVPPYAAPARAEDLSGLPPTYLDCGNLEVFRDEDIAYATRLLQAGVPVELHCWPGVFHGWELAAPAADVTRRAFTARYAAMRRALHPAPAGDAPETAAPADASA